MPDKVTKPTLADELEGHRDSGPMTASLASSATRPSLITSPMAGGVALPRIDDVIGERYRIERLLAQGGMGAVYAATHVVSGKKVALKCMLPSLSQSPDASTRFIREARATARIDHPNVVDIYDVGSDGPTVYLVMELLQGETLHDRLSRSVLSPAQALSLIMPALRGVAAAHAHGVIHRDLKPDNIFLCQGPKGEPREPKVVDFGISKIANSDHVRDQGLTLSGVVMGTPYYMSPEQVRGTKELDERGDIYAFGVILYEMLAGQRPFQAETYNQLILKIATEDPVPLAQQNPAIDPRLAALVERAMARSPEARFASVEELAHALEPFAAGATFQIPSYVSGELDATLASSWQSRPPPTPAAGVNAIAMSAPTPAAIKTERVVAAGSNRKLIAIGVAVLLLASCLWLVMRSRPVAPVATVKPASAAPAAQPASPPSAAALPTAAAVEAAVAPALAAQPAASAALPTGLSGAAATHVESSKSKKAAPRAKIAAPAEAPAGQLAHDWDERVRIAPQPANGAPMPSAAGQIRRDDLR